MNNRDHALDDLLAKERAAYQKRVRRLREQARKDEERLALRTAHLIRDKHPDTYQRFEEEARRLLAEERATRSSRAKAASTSEQPVQGDVRADEQEGGDAA
ncbi:hypothetical protein M3T53_00425 [Actinomyces sp. B33]|uniref:hypothetical protein n=1 Tax=Actinomyces sp. B33 TaxID=2942131 RepID=UPI0023408590|nr:hypothetical protein [Actinomyces sp. B33]MDC4232183.1 hypothetical protein [Actinomyces sp. B33]